MTNRFEKKARTLKVRRICRAIRLASAGRQGNDGLRLSVERMTADNRLMIARIAGVNPPSATTWASVVRRMALTY